MAAAELSGPSVAMLVDSLDGGAGYAALRLFRALRKSGVAVDLYHFYGTCTDEGAFCLDGRAKRPPLERALKNVSRPGADRLRRHRHNHRLRDALAGKRYDLLHVHNLHACGVDMAGLRSVAAGRKVLWSLHDEFSFRGRPFPEDGELAPPAVPAALSDFPGLAFIGPSRWICQQVKEATQGRFPVHHSPYGIDPEAFAALDQTECRSTLGLDPDALWVGFAGGRDPRKGGDLLLEASRFLEGSRDVRLLAWGRPLPDISHGFRELRQLPYFKDSASQNRAYAACDLMLVPSRQDNFPLVVLESLASGTPVAASTRGGCAEAIEPGVNGFTLSLEPEAMAEQLRAVLEKATLAAMRPAARQRFEASYTSELEAERVRTLYESMMGGRP